MDRDANGRRDIDPLISVDPRVSVHRLDRGADREKPRSGHAGDVRAPSGSAMVGTRSITHQLHLHRAGRRRGPFNARLFNIRRRGAGARRAWRGDHHCSTSPGRTGPLAPVAAIGFSRMFGAAWSRNPPIVGAARSHIVISHDHNVTTIIGLGAAGLSSCVQRCSGRRLDVAETARSRKRRNLPNGGGFAGSWGFGRSAPLNFASFWLAACVERVAG